MKRDNNFEVYSPLRMSDTMDLMENKYRFQN